MADDETGNPAGPPLGGMGLTAILTLVSGVVLSRFDLPHGIDRISEIAGVLGLLAGSVTGWAFRDTLKAISLMKAAIGFLALGLASAISIFFVANSFIGMGPAIVIIISVALFTLSLGTLCAIAGIRISE